ncbi:MAG TPA: 30S ribosomal protein S20 [Candidatus Saccharimonadales bacterium]|nr:30S ribosomal protein S20 [Candidatus Saccharimonadales bacterium]
MANSRSARKRIRSSERKHVRNRAVKSAVRTKVIKARHALLEEGSATGEAELHAAIKALDRAAEKGILHPNNVRRRKSRLASMAARLASVAEGTEGAAARSAAAGGAKGRSAKQPTRAAAAKPAKSAVKPAGKAPAPKASAVKVTAAKAAAPKAAAPAKSPVKATKTK